MSILKHEIKMNFKSILIWSLSVGLMSFAFILIFPTMKSSLVDMSDSYSNMAGMSTVFGMDKLNIAEIMGFYGIEIGSVLSLGGSLFAAVLGIGILSKEEGGHTSEFIFTLPISRKAILIEKYLAMIFCILLFNVICITLIVSSFLIINEEIQIKEFILHQLSLIIMNIEIGSITFGISAFHKKSNFGIGIATSLILYFLDMMSKLNDKVEFLKYISPFSYCDASKVITSLKIDSKLLIPGLIMMIVFVSIGFFKYLKKDLVA